MRRVIVARFVGICPSIQFQFALIDLSSRNSLCQILERVDDPVLQLSDRLSAPSQQIFIGMPTAEVAFVCAGTGFHLFFDQCLELLIDRFKPLTSPTQDWRRPPYQRIRLHRKVRRLHAGIENCRLRVHGAHLHHVQQSNIKSDGYSIAVSTVRTYAV